MKLAIIGDPFRRKKDLPLVEEGGQFFETTYAPITEIRFDLDKKISVKHNHADLSEFDCILPVPTVRYKELFYAALRMLSSSLLPFSAESYLLACNDELLFNHLVANGITARNFLTVASNVSLRRIVDRIEFPVIVRPPNKRVMVTNPQTLEDVIALTKVGIPVKIEAPIKAERDVWLFVVGDEVVACYEKTEGSSKPVAIGGELKKIAIRVRQLAECDYCALRFLWHERWILDRFTLSPNFANFQKITGKNVARYLIGHLRERAKELERTWWQKKLDEIFRRS